MKYKVIRPHEGGDTEPLIVTKGENVRYERKPTSWPGWIWCVTSDGKVGWVPESWVEFNGEFCTMLRDYNSTELCVREDEILEVELTESSWAWCRSCSGDYGWVPVDAIEPEREGPHMPKMYDELAGWWHLLSDPADYAEEASHFVKLLLDRTDPYGREVFIARRPAS